MASQITGQVFNILFGVLLIGVSLYLICATGAAPPRGGQQPRPPGGLARLGLDHPALHRCVRRGVGYGFSLPIGLLISLGVGFLSTLLGIGGGIIHVPALVTLLGFPAHIATATSHFILAISSATGTGVNLGLGRVQLGPALAMGVGAIGGAQIGGRLARRVHGRWIVRGLAGALFLVGLRLLF